MTPKGSLGGRSIGRIGLGAMQLAGPGVFGPPEDPERSRAVLRRAVELGVDHIDTAQYYGPGVVNDLIRESLHPYPEGLRLVTKVGGRRDERGHWLPALQPEELRSAVEDNLRSLRVERMDMVNLRLFDGDGSEDIPMADQLGVLGELRDEGKVGLIGISSVSLARAEEAVGLAEIASIQNGYSVLERASQDLLELCRRRDLAFVPYFPLGSAFTGGPARLAENETVAGIAGKHGATPSQIALAWLLAIDERILLIPGTSSVEHLEENLAAGEIALDAEDIAALDALA